MPTLKIAQTAYRIGSIDNAFPIWSGIGPSIYPQRWNRKGQQVIYAAEHFATAMLETLARQSIPSNLQRYIEIKLPKGLNHEEIRPDSLKKWRSVGSRSARKAGGDWLEAGRSALLYVPSVIAPSERNIMLNPVHPDFDKITISEERPVDWDERLFK